MDNLISFLIAAAIIGFFLIYYLRQEKKKDKATMAAAERGKLRSDGPQSQHPHINNTYCIGCATCTMGVSSGFSSTRSSTMASPFPSSAATR